MKTLNIDITQTMLMLGYIATIFTIISFFSLLFYRIIEYRKLKKYVKEKWQNQIIGKWYSYSITYVDRKKEITAYEWNFKYLFWKGHYGGTGKSLRDTSVAYKNLKLEISGDFIFLTAKGVHLGEYIYGILKEYYPISTSKKIKGVISGLTYHPKKPFSTEIIFTKTEPDLVKLNENIDDLKLSSKSYTL